MIFLKKSDHKATYVESNYFTEDSISLKQTDSMLGYLFGTLKRTWLCLTLQYDLLIIQKFIPLTFPCIVIAKIRKKKIVVDWDDIDSDLQTNFTRRIITLLCEKFGPKFVNFITTHSFEIKKIVKDKFMKNATLINQGVDFTLFDPAKYKKEDLIKKYELKNKIILGYLGTLTHGGIKDVDIIIDAVSDVIRDNRDVVLFVVGGGPSENYFRSLVDSRGISDFVYLTGLVDQQEVPRYLNLFDVSLIYMRDDYGNRSRVSFKALESLAMNKTIIGHVIGETKRRFGKYIVEVGEDKSKYKNEIIKFIGNGNKKSKYREDIIDEYSWDNVEVTYMKFIERLTNRVDINLGFSCNEKCRFCYYLKSVEARERDKDLSTEEAKKTLDYIYSRGIRILDFTGGEPTIRKDFVELVQYAKAKGFQNISLITNGIVLARKEYAERVIDAGVNDFLFSLHAPDPETHDNITRVKGSYSSMLKAINNIIEIKKIKDISYRSNTVVCGLNYNKIDDSLKLLYSLGFQTINFIMFNPIVEANTSDMELNVEYSKAAPYLMKEIDEYKDKIKKLTVRYMPFCQMCGYEKYITNMPQIQYDEDEWDYLIRTKIREGALVSFSAMCFGILLLPKYKRIFEQSFNIVKHEGIKKFLEVKNKKKGPMCKECSYEYICDGLWNEYVKWRGFEELKAVPGEKIIDPAYFLKKR